MARKTSGKAKQPKAKQPVELYSLNGETSPDYTSPEQVRDLNPDCRLGSRITDAKGKLYAFVVEVDGRRVWLPWDFMTDMYLDAVREGRTRGFTVAENAGFRLGMLLQWEKPRFYNCMGAVFHRVRRDCRVTDAQLIDWSRGNSIPNQEQREALERFFRGEILASDWLEEPVPCEPGATKGGDDEGA